MHHVGAAEIVCAKCEHCHDDVTDTVILPMPQYPKRVRTASAGVDAHAGTLDVAETSVDLTGVAFQGIENVSKSKSSKRAMTSGASKTYNRNKSKRITDKKGQENNKKRKRKMRCRNENKDYVRLDTDSGEENSDEG